MQHEHGLQARDEMSYINIFSKNLFLYCKFYLVGIHCLSEFLNGWLVFFHCVGLFQETNISRDKYSWSFEELLLILQLWPTL